MGEQDYTALLAARDEERLYASIDAALRLDRPPLTDQAGVQGALRDLAPRYGVDPRLVDAIIQHESGYNPSAASPKGAVGLMQLMPATVQRFRVVDPWNPEQNIQGGMRFLQYLAGKYPGRTDLQLAAYNAGEGAVDAHGRTIPPYPETQQFVQSVLQTYQRGRPAQQTPSARQQVPPPVRDERLYAQPGAAEATARGEAGIGAVPPLLEPQQALTAQPGTQAAPAALSAEPGIAETQARMATAVPLSDTQFRTSEGRLVSQDAAGNFITEQTITVNDPRINEGRWTNIPTIFGGQKVNDSTATDLIAAAGGKDPDTGRQLPSFDSLSMAEGAAQKRSESLGRELNSGLATRPHAPGQLLTQPPPISPAYLYAQNLPGRVGQGFLNSLADVLAAPEATGLIGAHAPAGDMLRTARTTLHDIAGTLATGQPDLIERALQTAGGLLPFFGAGLTATRATQLGMQTLGMAARGAGLTGAAADAVTQAGAMAGGIYDQLVPLVGEEEASRRANTVLGKASVLFALAGRLGPYAEIGQGAIRILGAAIAGGVQGTIQHSLQTGQFWVPSDSPHAEVLRQQGWTTDGDRLVAPDPMGNVVESALLMAVLSGSKAALTEPLLAPRPAGTVGEMLGTGARELAALAPTPGLTIERQPEAAPGQQAQVPQPGEPSMLLAPPTLMDALQEGPAASEPGGILSRILGNERGTIGQAPLPGPGAAPPPPALPPGPTIREGAQGMPASRYRDAQGNWRIPLRDMPPEELELQDWIRQQGGIKLAGETDVPGELRALISRRETGIGGLHNDTSGRTLQQMAELAQQHGFTFTADKTALLDAMGRSISQGHAVYSAAATGEVPLLDNPLIRQAYDTVLGMAETWGPRVAAQRRGVRPRAAVSEEARQAVESGQWIFQDIQELLPGTALNDTDIVGVVTQMSRLGKIVRQAAQAYVDSGGAVGSPEEQHLLQLVAFYSELSPQRLGVLAEAGRTLGILNDPQSGMNEYLRRLDTQIAGSPDLTTRQLARNILRIPNDVALSKTLVKQAQAGGMFEELWYNGMLSGFRTHLNNTADNLATAAFAVPDRGFAVLWSSILPGGEVSIHEVPAMVQGMGSGLLSFWHWFAEAFAKNAPQLQVETRQAIGSLAKTPTAPAITAERLHLDPNTPLGKAVDFLASYVGLGTGGRIPTRALMAADDAAFGLSYYMELHAQAARAAQVAVEAGTLPRAELGRFTTDYVLNPPDNGRMAAVSSGVWNTLNSALVEGTLGSAMQSVQGLKLPIPGTDLAIPAGRILLPFLRVAVNMERMALQRTPMGLVSQQVIDQLKAGGASRDIALGRMTTGSLILGTAVYLAATGLLRGRGPINPDLRAAGHWDERQYTINLPGTDVYVGYRNLGAFGMLLGMAADAVQIAGEVDPNMNLPGKIAVGAYHVLSNNILSQTWMQGMTRFFDAVTYKAYEKPEQFGQGIINLLQGTVASGVPASWAQVVRATDPVIREVHDLLDRAYARVPGWAADLPARRDRWGDKKLLGWGFGEEWLPRLYNALSPVQLLQGELSPVEKELVQHQIELGMPPKTLAKSGTLPGQPASSALTLPFEEAPTIRLTPQQYEQLTMYRGANLSELQQAGLTYPDRIWQQVRRGVGTLMKQEPPGAARSAKAILDWVVQQPAYLSPQMTGGPEGGKSLLLKRLDEVFTQIGQQVFLANNPDLAQQVVGGTLLKAKERLPADLHPLLEQQMQRQQDLLKEQQRVFLGR